jgi:hypothetical protein
VVHRSRSRFLLGLALAASGFACSSSSGDYCSSKFTLAPKFGSCDVGLLSPDIQVTYALPDPQSCEQALTTSCTASEQQTLQNQAACLNRVASAQPTCVDGGEAAWSDGLVAAQVACRDAGVSGVCTTAIEQSQQTDDGGMTLPDGGLGDGGPIDFCKQSISAAYDVGTCDFGDAGLELVFVGSIVPASEVATCEAAITNCTSVDVDTLNAQVTCADGIPAKVGTCQAGNEAGFIEAANAQFNACLGTSSNITARCVESISSFYPRDGGIS